MTINDMIIKKKEQGLSNEMIAEATGIPLATVQKIFSGATRVPRKATIDKLMGLFNNVNGDAGNTRKRSRDGAAKPVHERYFQTDGFRGKAGVNLTAEHAFRIGRFLGWFYGRDGEKARIVIGKDTRRSSYMFESALAAGISASGGDAYLLHVTTSPCVSYITRMEDFNCGIMISASHNPYYDNGIKLLNTQGEKMSDEMLIEIEDYIDGRFEIPYATNESIGRINDYYFGRNKYIGYLTSLAVKSFENCKAGIDCANGSAWMMGRAVFDALGAKTFVINNEPTGTNVNMNCGSTHMEGLQEFVRNRHLDVGFAFDGDADRCLAVDEKGNVINGDQILYICAKYLKDRNQFPTNTVVGTVMTNMGLLKALDRLDIRYELTKVGDRYVYENMKANGYMLGGEQSGHIIFRDHAHTGDGIITAIMVMNVMIDTQLPLSVLARNCKMYPQILTNVEVDDKEGTISDKFVVDAVKAAEKKLGDKGRVLLRKSGTEPVLRVMSEALEYDDAEKAVEAIIDSMRRNNHLLKIRR